MSLLTAEEYRTVLRQDFYTFLHRGFYELNPQTVFLPNWHIELMAAKLEACRLGQSRRLIINIPPRHLKSHCASIAFSAWLLGHNPAAQLINVSYGQDLADKLARDARALIQSDWYQAIFPTRLSGQRQATQDFMTTQQGCRLATSVGGVLTGRGADFIILDDPLKPDEALSETQRRACNDWYDTTLCTRLNDKLRGVIIVVMQRLHEDDLVGHLLAQEEWDVVSFPAIAEQEESFVIQSPWGRRRQTRQVGDLLHPERESQATLAQIRRTMGEWNFAGQYQQAPAPQGGGMVKAEWFLSYGLDERAETFDEIVQSWDTANKETELSDFSVCTTWGIKREKIFLLHVLRKRLNYPDLKRAVRTQAELHRATVVLIEDKASGTQLIQELVYEGLSIVQGVEPEGNKVMRLHAQTAIIENGFVSVPKEAPWLAEYLHELTTFPKGKYDDQADSTAQALAWIKASQSAITFSYDMGWGLERETGFFPSNWI
jgi:predicted phage terminase large subunit-like protein